MKSGIIIFLLTCLVGGYIVFTNREKVHTTESKTVSDYYGYKEPEHIGEINARNAKADADHEATRLKESEPGVVVETICIAAFLGLLAIGTSKSKEN
jgi:hypothetical protein